MRKYCACILLNVTVGSVCWCEVCISVYFCVFLCISVTFQGANSHLVRCVSTVDYVRTGHIYRSMPNIV